MAQPAAAAPPIAATPGHAAQTPPKRTVRVALPSIVEGPQDLLLLCCGGDGCVMTSGALLKALSPQVLHDMV